MEQQGATQVRVRHRSSLAPMRASLHLRRQCACGQHTIGGGECEECRKKHESMSERAGVVPVPASTMLSSSTEGLDQAGLAEANAEDVFLKESHFHHDFSLVPGSTVSPENGYASTGDGVPFAPSPIPLSSTAYTPSIQAKNEAAPSIDVHEQEADEVASQATRSEPRAGYAERAEKAPLPQPFPASDGVLGILEQSPGMPLSSTVRKRVEPLFGVDLNSVRVHNDAIAGEAASILHAKAFTSQNHIWLASGQSPESVELMAHEAAHVMQQAALPTPQRAIQRKIDDTVRVEDGEEIRKRMQQRIREAEEQPSRPEAARTESDADVAAGQNGVVTSRPDAHQAARSIDPRALAEKRRELEPDAVPSVDRQAEVRPQVEQAKEEVKEKSQEPPQPLQKQGIVPPAAKEPGAAQKTGSKQDIVGDAEAASGLADAALVGPSISMTPALSGAGAAPVPPAPSPGPALSLDIAPVDANGEPLPTNPAVDAQVADLAQQAQVLREQGQLLRVRAAEEMGNAQILRGNIGLIQKNVGHAEQSVKTSRDHLEFRRGAVDKARQALSVSEQKAAMVAKEAPTYSAKSDEGQQRSAPMAHDAAQLASENKSKTPDDPDAADKSREQGDKLNKVSSDTATVNDAISQTRERAATLSEDAARATQVNSATGAKIETMQETLQQSDQRLSQMQQQNAQARSEVEEARSQPGQMHAQAVALDAQGASLIEAAAQIEQQLQQTQAQYVQDLRAIPVAKETEAEADLGNQQVSLETGTSPERTSEAVPSAGSESESTLDTQEAQPSGEENASQEQSSPSASSPLASQPPTEPSSTSEAQTAQNVSASGAQAPGAGGYEQRIHINVAEALPSWLTGEGPDTEEEKSQAELEHQKAQKDKSEQRAADLKFIMDKAHGDFNTLSAADKAAIALGLTGKKLFGFVSKIQWPGWGKVGKFAKGLIDPRGLLAGALGGFSMIVSAEANLLSKEQWQRDPLGNLLKSAADIATGLTIIFGSITALAALIIAIATAATILSFGLAAAVTGPIIAFCATIVSVVGGWTIYTGAIALVLQALVFIKNLIDAATAQTAEELASKSDDMKEDISNAGNVLLQMGMAKLAQIHGNKILSKISAIEEGGAAAYARTLPGEFARNVRTLPSRVAGRVRAIGGGIARGTKAVGRGVETAAGGVARGTKALGRGIKAGARGVKKLVGAVGREGETEAETLASRGAAKLGTEAEQIASLGKMSPETETLLKNNPTLRDALAQNPEAADALKLCASYCFPENATPDQITQLNDFLKRAKEAGIKVDRMALKKFLYQRRANLGKAIGTLEKRFGTKLAAPVTEAPSQLTEQELSKAEQIEKEFEEAGKMAQEPPEEIGNVSADTEFARRYAHDVGVEHGRVRAIEDGLRTIEWENPLADRGGFGQGLDDVMETANGDPVLVEYKGGDAKLSPGQMEKPWVEEKIAELRAMKGNKMATDMAERLDKALKEGRLTGRAYRTRIGPDGQPMPTQQFKTWEY